MNVSATAPTTAGVFRSAQLPTAESALGLGASIGTLHQSPGGVLGAAVTASQGSSSGLPRLFFG